MFPRNAKFVVALVGLVITFLLVTSDSAESFPTADSATEAPTDNPRHTPAVKPFGPYRLIQPSPQREQKIVQVAKVAEPKLLKPVWTGNVYVVKSGDTLSGIAPHLKVSAGELARCSGIGNPNRISIGQKIHKPGTCVAPPPAPQKTVTQRIDTPAPASGTVETAISFAMAQLGDPYVWAANGPDSWDCSGLVHAAFAHAGIAISRSTKTLIHEGISVSRGEMVRGDLVFPSDGHVGIYLGNGQFVHAPQSGDVVKVGSVYSFYAARRVA